MNNFNLPPIADTAAHHAELLSGVNNLLATAAFHDVKAADLNMDYVYSEELGDINSQGMAQVLNVYKERRRMIASSRFEPNEERGRKFHLGPITDQQIIADIGTVKSVESGETVVYKGTTAVKEGGVAEILNMDHCESLGLLTQDVTQDPSRFRLRIEDDFGFLFNTVTFNITVLNLSEAKEFKRIII
mgnify:CR=1 FL=1